MTPDAGDMGDMSGNYAYVPTVPATATELPASAASHVPFACGVPPEADMRTVPSVFAVAADAHAVFGWVRLQCSEEMERFGGTEDGRARSGAKENAGKSLCDGQNHCQMRAVHVSICDWP